MSIATRQGDDGTTQLLFGPRVSKGDPRVEAYGGVDELGSFLGLARHFAGPDPVAERLEALQREMFVLGAELATPPESRGRLIDRLDAARLAGLDAQVAELEAVEGLLSDWALPGATAVGAYLDVARTVCRRIERTVVRLIDDGLEPGGVTVQYLNRLADLLWLYARWYEVRHHADGRLRK